MMVACLCQIKEVSMSLGGLVYLYTVLRTCQQGVGLMTISTPFFCKPLVTLRICR